MSFKIHPFWNEKLKELTGFDFFQDIKGCFERLYLLYDENFKPAIELFITSIQKSMVSTCEPTPNCKIQEKDKEILQGF